MQHLLFLAYIIAFAVGFATILFSILFYLKEKIRWVFYYLFLLIPFTVLLFIYALQLYNVINTNVTSDVLAIFIFINLGTLSYFIPYVITKITSANWGKKHNAVAIPIIVAYVVMLILSFALERHFVFYTILNAIFYGALLYSLILGVIRLKKIEHPQLKIIIGIFILLSAVFAPFFFFDTYAAAVLPTFKERSTNTMWALPIYYFWWNISVLSYFVSYFYNIKSSPNFGLTEEFIRDKRITPREQEILELITKGMTNNEIGRELDISPNTVNNHIANIYEKTGFRSRFEIITLLKRKF